MLASITTASMVAFEQLELDIPTIAIRLGAALLIGGALGWEREVQHRPAGLRTYILVTQGAAIFALISVALTHNQWESPSNISLDPARILGAIVGGIGFLGAGAIIQSRGEIRGLTTAAGLWVAASLGAAAGLGLYYLAAAGGIITIITMSLLRLLEPDDNDGEETDKDTG